MESAFHSRLAHILAGEVNAAQRIGIQHILWLPMVMMGVGFVLSLFTRETRQA